MAKSKQGEKDNAKKNQRTDYSQEIEAFERFVTMESNALDLMLGVGTVYGRLCKRRSFTF